MEKTAIELIADERKRQIEVEGWTPEHDDSVNTDGELMSAAACYAMLEDQRYIQNGGTTILDELWPWDPRWFKPTPDDRIRELAKAGALIVAAIEQIQRAKELAAEAIHDGEFKCCGCGKILPNSEMMLGLDDYCISCAPF